MWGFVYEYSDFAVVKFPFLKHTQLVTNEQDTWSKIGQKGTLTAAVRPN